jgi:hypothetical protein
MMMTVMIVMMMMDLHVSATLLTHLRLEELVLSHG